MNADQQPDDADAPKSADATAGVADAAVDGETADEVKDKFREALERKRAHGAGGQAHLDGGAKSSGQHGPAHTQRTFRRKSG